MSILRRVINSEARVLDAKEGIMEYVASDETLDSYQEIIRADGWRFDRMKKNAPFVDSHNYGSVAAMLGKVVDFKVAGRKLVETVQWAIGVGHELAELGWKLASNGFLPAVSVGFIPVRSVSAWQAEKAAEFRAQLAELGIKEADQVRTIYTEQQQVELSAVIVPANPNAVARAYRAGLLDDADLGVISAREACLATLRDAGLNMGFCSEISLAIAYEMERGDPEGLARKWRRTEFLERFERLVRRVGTGRGK